MSTSADSGKLVVVGHVAGVFGVRGWIRVFSYTDPPENILQYGPWRLGDDGDVPYRVSDGARRGRGIVAHLAGVDDRDAARALIGKPIRVPREGFGAVAAGQYFWSDLLGMEVLDQAGIALGRVQEMLETGANDVLVVQGDRRRLIPFLIGSVVTSVDLEAGRITVDWDPGF